MPGSLTWGWYPEDNKWVKLRVDADGSIHIVGYVDELDDIGDVNMPAPADHDIMDWDAATSKWVKRSLGDMGAHHARHDWLGADAVDIAPKIANMSIALLITWDTHDAWTEGHSGSGSATWAILNHMLHTGATINSVAKTYAGDFLGPFYNTVWWGSAYLVSLAANQVIWLGAFATTTPSDIQKHIGFKIIGSRLWASSADGVTQEITDTGIDVGVWGGHWLSFHHKGTSIDFYVSGVLKATHSNHFPTSGACYLINYITNTDAVNHILRTRHINVTQE